MDWLGNSRTVGGSVRNAGESGWQRFRPLFPTPRMRGAVFFVGAHPVRDSPAKRQAATPRSRTRCAPTV